MSETRTLRVVVVGNAKQASAALRQLGGDADRMGNNVQRSGTRFMGVMGKIGKSAAVGFGAAATAAGYFTYKVGAPYEQALNKIQVLNDQSDAQMQGIAKRLEGNALNYAKMGLSVGDAAGGVVELTKAGMGLDDAMKSVNDTMVLSKAGGMGVADSAALVSNSMNVWKDDGLSAADAANVLANAANISSADVSDLAQSLQMASNVSAGAGASFQETNAMLAMLSNAGMKGSDAGTSLKTMLLSLQAPSSTAAKNLKAIGVNAFDSSGKARPLRDVLAQLDEKFKGMSDQSRAKRLKGIFGSDAYRAAKVIFGQHVDQYDKYVKNVDKAGAASKLAQSASKGLSGTVSRLGAGFKSLGQILYRALAPVVNKALKPVAKALEGLLPKIQPAVKALSGMFSGGTGKGGEQFAKTFESIKKFGEALWPTLKKIGENIMAVVGPAFKDISAMVTNDLLPAFRKFLPVVLPIAKFLLNILGNAIVGVIKGVVNVVKGVINMITGFFKLFAAVAKGDWGAAWDALKQIVKGAIQAIWGAIQIWWNGSILALFRRIPLALKGLWSKAWSGLKSLASKGVSAIEKVLLKILDVVTRPFRSAFSAVKGYVSSGWQYIKGAFSGGVGGVKGILMRIIEVWLWPYKQVFNLVKNLVTGAWGAVKGLFSTGISNVMGVLRTLKGKVTGVFTGAKEWLKNAGMDIIRGILAGLDAAKQWVVDKIKEVTDLIPGWVKKRLGIASPSKVMKELAKWITVGIAEGIADSAGVKKLRRALGKIRDHIKEAFKDKDISRKSKDHLLDILKDRQKRIEKALEKRLALVDKMKRAEGKVEKAREALEAAMQALDSKREERQGFKESLAGTAKSFGSLMGVWGDESQSNSVGAILKRFAKRLENIRNFRANLNALSDRGLSQSLINQIASEGPDAGGLMAATLLKATPDQMGQFNQIGADIDSESFALGEDNAGRTYDADIAGLEQGVRDREADLATAKQNVVNVKIDIRGNVTSEKELVEAIKKQIRDALERDNKRNGGGR